MMRSALIATVLLTLVAGCQTATPTGYEIPFAYRNLGAGPQPSAIVLTRGSEATLVSAALVAALQDLSYGVVSPPLQAGTALPERSWIETDIVPLTPEQVARMSSAAPSMRALPTDRQLGAAHRLQYAVKNGSIHVVDSVSLHERGSLSSGWSKFTGPYMNTFLLDQLRTRVEEHLKASRPS